MTKNKIAYFYQDGIGDYYYAPGHPMKPQRIKLAHHLLLSYGLYREMEVYRPHIATDKELSKFHSDEYVQFLSRITPDSADTLSPKMKEFSIGNQTDCPIFDGMYEFCRQYTGASLDAAVRLNHKLNDICVNWSGGLHHAKKTEASGFCYINDIVLAILELLKYHARVMYIDIDIHHGDGVEEAFYVSNRVLTVSFHKYGDYFPGTGDIKDIGAKGGKYYAINYPLNSWIDDDSYRSIFRPVVSRAIEMFRPGAIVLQCGADSITGDRLGCFNMSLHGHGNCVEYVKSFGIPLLVLGGGGYTIKNVARCWAFETSLIVERAVPDNIPQNDYIEWYAPTYKLHLEVDKSKENENTPESLNIRTQRILENLKELEHAPSVQMQHVPPDYARDIVDKDLDDDTRLVDKDGITNRKDHDGEMYDGDGDIDHDDADST